MWLDGGRLKDRFPTSLTTTRNYLFADCNSNSGWQVIVNDWEILPAIKYLRISKPR